MVKKAVRKNKYFVYEGNTLRAAQTTKKSALRYMKPGRKIRKTPMKQHRSQVYV